jgi:ubiquitin C-terminal hydrolase
MPFQTGLLNIGNSCFANASLICLFHSDIFGKIVHDLNELLTEQNDPQSTRILRLITKLYLGCKSNMHEKGYTFVLQSE